jgi:fatty-acyl-CoA synthase
MDLSRIVEHWARMTPARCAIHFQGSDISYAALWQRIDAATATLAQRHAVQPGERVAWLGLNHPDFIVALMALARLGAIFVPLNLRLAAAELSTILAHNGARVLFADGAMHELALQAAGGVSAGLGSGTGAGISVVGSDTLCEFTPTAMELPGHDDAPCLLVYSSGTTGRPKGALHTQANLLWNLQSAIAAQDITSSDHVLNPLPLFHVGGLCIQTLPVLAAGGCLTLHPRFEPGAWLDDVAARAPSLSLLVPATMRALIEHPAWAATPLNSLRCLTTGSSTIPRSLIDAFHARGIPVAQVYGATETGPVSIVLRPQEAMQHAGSAGKPAMHVQIMLVDSQGHDVPPGKTGETGEVWVRGKNVVARYWGSGTDGGDACDDEQAALAGGWFRTGDLARRDEHGYFWIVGRATDMIISGGENIHPAELENLLADCPAIAEAAVVAQDDARWGEVAVAVVVRRPGAALAEADVMRLFEGRIARYKHPRRVVFAQSLPKTALGKVQKAELRRALASGSVDPP